MQGQKTYLLPPECQKIEGDEVMHHSAGVKMIRDLEAFLPDRRFSPASVTHYGMRIFFVFKEDKAW